MVDLKKLKEAIDSSGVTNRHIASSLGITEQSFSNKMNGRTEFKVTEMNLLINVLHLSKTDAYCIFFAGCVH